MILILTQVFCMVLMVGVFMACDGKTERRKVLPSSKGLPNELLLIVDEAVWNSSLRDSIEKVLKADVPGLSQSEPLFRMMRLYPQHFTARYTTMRNIVELRINPNLKECKMNVAYNVKAHPQIYISVFAPNPSALSSFLSVRGHDVVDLLVCSELEYEMQQLKKKYSKVVDVALREVLGCSVNVPSDIKKVKKAEQFLWASTDRLDKDLNFVAYSLPYEKNGTRFIRKWVDARDSVMRINIPGSTPEKWMTTTKEAGTPLVLQQEIRLNDGRKVYEMRGLWEMHKGAIGGPFVSLAFPDSLHHRMIVIEGFVYSPDTGKRNLLRRMEASLRTLNMKE